jgi:outer membrane protein OmpA-like peptidoglycan-associated protein
VQRVVAGIQAKLKVGQPGDVYEQEADRVADEVMRMPEPEEQESKEELIQTKPISEPMIPLVQRQVEEEEEEILQTKAHISQTPEVTPNLEARINAMRGGGQPLSESVRAFFEPRFGYDFSQVRLHTDTQAAESARAVNARAFTVGRDIVFGAGQYTLGTSAGRRLMAHELTHVTQQRAVGPKLQLASLERAAEGVAEGPERHWATEHPQGFVDRKGPDHCVLWNFDVGSAQLKPEHKKKLSEIIKSEWQYALLGATIHVHGHASKSGTREENEFLSDERAAEVVNYLISYQGVDLKHVKWFYHGFSDPWFPNLSGRSMAHNRRVELNLKKLIVMKPEDWIKDRIKDVELKSKKCDYSWVPTYVWDWLKNALKKREITQEKVERNYYIIFDDPDGGDIFVQWTWHSGLDMYREFPISNPDYWHRYARERNFDEREVDRAKGAAESWNKRMMECVKKGKNATQCKKGLKKAQNMYLMWKAMGMAG